MDLPTDKFIPLWSGNHADEEVRLEMEARRQAGLCECGQPGSPPATRKSPLGQTLEMKTEATDKTTLLGCSVRP
ncbi:MAG: hypothetical protein H6822_03835 [Planctomycetaceae bacterium]|nr:hypothetical protein [Planctomycetales bacterium]MCB9921287.1 hypothetical protein [Planctomycetaceae bacterium]